MQASHVASLRELLQSHALVKVQLNMPDANLVTVCAEQLASQSGMQWHASVYYPPESWLQAEIGGSWLQAAARSTMVSGVSAEGCNHDGNSNLLCSGISP